MPGGKKKGASSVTKKISSGGGQSTDPSGSLMGSIFDFHFQPVVIIMIDRFLDGDRPGSHALPGGEEDGRSPDVDGAVGSEHEGTHHIYMVLVIAWSGLIAHRHVCFPSTTGPKTTTHVFASTDDPGEHPTVVGGVHRDVMVQSASTVSVAVS